MKQKYQTFVKIPEGINCTFKDGVLDCKKDNKEFSRKIGLLDVDIKVADGKIGLFSTRANKKTIKLMMSMVSHLKNGIKGLEDGFQYKLEICNVHFPMTVKVEGNRVMIGNFLGEKKMRSADILPGVKVEISGREIEVSGQDIEKTGQTAANIEKATRVRSKDRRIFQDGIFITEKAKGVI